MKKLTSLACMFLISSCAFASNLFVFWTNGDNVGTNLTTTVMYGTAPGVYTMSTNVPFAQTNVWVTGLQGNQRFYVVAVHTDGVETSVPSNEGNAKTKQNPPKNTTVTQ